MTDCIFCKIANKQIPSKIVYEDKEILAFEDINPQAPVHIIVIPKEHYANLHDAPNLEGMGDMFSAIKKIAEEKGLDKSGFRVVLNSGKDAGQLVPHLHFHILAGRPLSWPPG